MRPGLLIALIIAIGLAAAVMMTSTGPAPAPVAQTAAAPEIRTTNIYVAAQPIPIGTVVKQEMLTIQPWPEHLVLPGFMRADGGAQNVVGYVARSPFQPQEPIINSKLAKPSDPNFLAGELPKGMRVITIMTNETEGVAGFLFPGDHVDVMLTHDVERPRPGGRGEMMREVVTESLLNNVTVLAVDQRAAGAQSADPEGKLAIPRSVSLMVSPTDAQRIRLGQKVGTLTLSLRALADRESADPMTLTQQRDISQFKSAAPEAKPAAASSTTVTPDGVVIIRGIEKEVEDAPAQKQSEPNNNNSESTSNTSAGF